MKEFHEKNQEEIAILNDELKVYNLKHDNALNMNEILKEKNNEIK